MGEAILRLALALGLAMMVTTFASASQDSGYQGPVLPVNPTTSSPGIAVLWRDRFDFGLEGVAEHVLTVGEGHGFYLRNGSLVASNLATGRRTWSSGSGMKGPVAYGKGQVYAVVSDGQVAALSARTGAQRWVFTLGERISGLWFLADLVLAKGFQGGVALDPDTGKVHWPIPEPESQGPAGVTDNLLLWRVFQGEPHFPHLLAYDIKTGRQAWRVGAASGPLAVEGDRIYVDDAWVWTQLDNPDNVQIRVIDRKSGKETARWRYRANLLCNGILGESGPVVMNEAFLYVGERCQDQVARFPGGGAQKPVVRYATYDGGRWIAGPSRGMLIFETLKHRLLGVRVEGGPPTTANGVRMPTGLPLTYEAVDNPVSRLDFIGDLIVVGQTDGWAHVIEFASGKKRFSVRASGRGFGPTLRVGSYFIVQAQGEILVLRLPP